MSTDRLFPADPGVVHHSGNIPIARIMLTHELQYYVQYRYNVNWFCKEVMILWEHISFDILLFFIAL